MDSEDIFSADIQADQNGLRRPKTAFNQAMNLIVRPTRGISRNDLSNVQIEELDEESGIGEAENHHQSD